MSDLKPGFYYVRPIYPEPRQPWTVGELRPARPNLSAAYWLLVGSNDPIYQYGDKLVNDELVIGDYLDPQPGEQRTIGGLEVFDGGSGGKEPIEIKLSPEATGTRYTPRENGETLYEELIGGKWVPKMILRRG